VKSPTLNNYTVDRPLLPQLAAIGYTPANITYMALSHYHGDHVANASLFAGSTWIVQKGDRDPILAPRPAGSRVPDPKFFEGLANSKTVLLNGEDHDVFGDGTVVIKSTPGHTPGHQALFLKLANTGNVLLSGDLYHYPEEITYKKVPNFDTRSSPSRFAPIPAVMEVTPVMLPPGWSRLETMPASTGSAPKPKTIGIVVVAAFAIRV
jgi:N-acyl homoserine lactone hydrolase